MSKVACIHQPNFFPWLGYFNKIARCDRFIFLDDVQFPKKGGAWCNRVKLMVSAEERWVTAPIDRNYQGVLKINQMHFMDNNIWKKKLIKTISFNYKSAPFYRDMFDFFEPLICNSDTNVSSFNIHAVTEISKKLDIDLKKFYVSSRLPVDECSNERLICLTKSVGSDSYMCGGGADSYQDENIFRNNNIKLIYQNFNQIPYAQSTKNCFVSGLSIIDALMNVGWDGVKRLI
jgi:hypothetical protein